MKTEDKINNIEFMIKEVETKVTCLTYLEKEAFDLIKRRLDAIASLSTLQKKILFNLWEKVNNS